FRRKRVPHIPCRDVVEIVTAYLENALDDETRRRLEYHLTLCDPCVDYVEQVRRTIAITNESIAPESLSPELRDGLRMAFAEDARRLGRPGRLRDGRPFQPRPRRRAAPPRGGRRAALHRDQARGRRGLRRVCVRKADRPPGRVPDDRRPGSNEPAHGTLGCSP